MKNAIIMLLSFFVLASCSFEGSQHITVEIPPDTRLEGIWYESPYYTLTVFDGAEVRDIFVPIGRRTVDLNVYRGSLILFMLKPPEGYSPLVTWMEPDEPFIRPFSYDGASLVSALLSVARKRPAIVSDLSLSAVAASREPLDSVSPAAFTLFLQKGSLDRSSPIERRAVKVSLENLLRGVWVSDRDDIPDLRVNTSGTPLEVKLYPGEYRFLNRERDLMVKVTVLGEDNALSAVGRAPKWY